jgi:carboxymethylenebutenolidase
MYQPDRVEYNITSGHIQIAMEDGTMLPAYMAHPNIATKFPGIALIHDWWGLTDLVRHVAHLFAQSGHYVIAPDLFNGKTAATREQALQLIDTLGSGGYKRIDTALSVLENHHLCNANVAAVGLGMGGSLAYEAAIVRPDLEAAVAYAGFPQRYLGYFKRSNTPVLAFYGENEPYISRDLIEKLRQELAGTPLGQAHEVIVLEGAGHDILTDDATLYSALAMQKTLNFLLRYLGGPARPALRKKL